VAKAVADWFTGTILPSLKKAWDQLGAVVGFAYKLIKGYINALIAVWKFLWQATVNFFKLIWAGIKLYFDLVVKVIKFAVNVIKALFNAWLTGVRTVVSGIGSTIMKVVTFFQQMKDRAIAQAKALISYVTSLPKRILSALGNLGRLLFNKGAELVQGLINGIKSMLGRLRDTAASLVGPLGRFLPGSPAKEGPLSGKGYVYKRGRRMVEDFAAGVVVRAADARDAVRRMVSSVGDALPSASPTAVASATSRIGSTPAPTVVAPSTAAPSRTVTIGNLNINGTWDLGDATVPRRFVSKLHTELDRYVKEYR
jgi:phage-related protein